MPRKHIQKVQISASKERPHWAVSNAPRSEGLWEEPRLGIRSMGSSLALLRFMSRWTHDPQEIMETDSEILGQEYIQDLTLESPR